MPDLKIRYPNTYFNDNGEPPSEEFRAQFAVSLAEAVAWEMNCLDYDFKPLELQQDQIDVHLIPYEIGNTRFTGAPVLVEITGYDYPHRMRTIGRRLRRTRKRIEFLIRDLDRSLVFEGKLVNVTYIPIPDGCWA